MSKRDIPRNLVPHPRFGDRSEPSGFAVPLDEIRDCYFYDRLHIFLQSAIPANVSRQNFTVMPRSCYIDMLKGCRKCGRDFIFFAREQQYWYEELGFNIAADCVHCPECRQSTHRLRQVFQRFSKSIGINTLSDEELTTHVEDAVFLFEAGVLRKEQKLRRLKNLAQSRLPESDACRAIVGLVDRIQANRESTD